MSDTHEHRPGSLAGAGAKWDAPRAGRDYSERRWADPRRRGRDARALGALLRASGIALEGALLLDAPCGSGRLLRGLGSGLGARWVGLDAAAGMLGEARGAGAALLVRGSLERLPFAERAFQAVLACRILHHLDEEALRLAVRELVRVSRDAVLVSFWDSASLPAWGARHGLARAEGPAGRRSHPRALLAAAFAESGAEIQRFASPLRFLDRQTYALARRRDQAR